MRNEKAPIFGLSILCFLCGGEDDFMAGTVLGEKQGISVEVGGKEASMLRAHAVVMHESGVESKRLFKHIQ